MKTHERGTMSIDQLDLLLYDTYQMDAPYPYFYGGKNELYKRVSYSQWAINELKNFIAERIYPRTSGSVNEFCKLTSEFMGKMARYASLNSGAHIIFDSAYEITGNILDLLETMK